MHNSVVDTHSETSEHVNVTSADGMQYVKLMFFRCGLLMCSSLRRSSEPAWRASYSCRLKTIPRITLTPNGSTAKWVEWSHETIQVWYVEK